MRSHVNRERSVGTADICQCIGDNSDPKNDGIDEFFGVGCRVTRTLISNDCRLIGALPTEPRNQRDDRKQAADSHLEQSHGTHASGGETRRTMSCNQSEKSRMLLQIRFGCYRSLVA